MLQNALHNVAEGIAGRETEHRNDVAGIRKGWIGDGEFDVQCAQLL